MVKKMVSYIEETCTCKNQKEIYPLEGFSFGRIERGNSCTNSAIDVSDLNWIKFVREVKYKDLMIENYPNVQALPNEIREVTEFKTALAFCKQYERSFAPKNETKELMYLIQDLFLKPKSSIDKSLSAPGKPSCK